MRKPIIAGNWKMNLGPAQAKELIEELKPLVAGINCDVVVCPPFVDLPVAAQALSGSGVMLGCQNIHWAEKGAFTGEISASMLKELGVSYAIVGHSERRQYFGETDEGVNVRLKAALCADITPILCVGESLAQREAEETDAIVARQVERGLKDVSSSEAARVVVAYEPIWAIGTGKTATAVQAEETIGLIREILTALYGQKTAQGMRIQYGGSMNGNNAKELMEMPNIDGGLIGGASLKAVEFAQIVHSARKAKA